MLVVARPRPAVGAAQAVDRGLDAPGRCARSRLARCQVVGGHLVVQRGAPHVGRGQQARTVRRRLQVGLDRGIETAGVEIDEELVELVARHGGERGAHADDGEDHDVPRHGGRGHTPPAPPTIGDRVTERRAPRRCNERLLIGGR